MFSDAQELKFLLLEHGIGVTPQVRQHILGSYGDNSLSSSDFASTSGMILRLEDNVWVNTPLQDFNSNFVSDSCPFILEVRDNSLFASGMGLESRAEYWPQPRFHGELAIDGQPVTNYVVTHGDRARLSPLHGCSMVCKFCDVPYGRRYEKKNLEVMVDAVRRATTDPIQPARHLLISGGTPRDEDIDWLRNVYRTMLLTFPEIDIDIMMVPTGNLIDIDELQDLGVCQFSINMELYSDSVARRMMPRKHRQGREHYLNFIEQAANKLGPGRVRSMLMVGLEPEEDTLAGVRAIAERGGVPVLSPFRPDPITPLRFLQPPKADLMKRVFTAASDILESMGSELGPNCVPCTHNTLTLVSPTEMQGVTKEKSSYFKSMNSECRVTF